MTAAVPRIDAFGFAESSRAIGSMVDNANSISFAVQRCAALLRSLNFQLFNTREDEISMSDVTALVELALLALPDPNGDSFNVFEQLDLEAQTALRAAQNRQQAMDSLISALEVAASMGSTLAELDEAANTAYGITTTLPDGQRHWDAFCELIVRRGLSLELVEIGAGFASHPIIHTPETLKNSKAAKRKTAELSAALHDEATARAQNRKAAPRRAA